MSSFIVKIGSEIRAQSEKLDPCTRPLDALLKSPLGAIHRNLARQVYRLAQMPIAVRAHPKQIDLGT
ncbi:MAG: hypothetical protein OXN84_05705 [Albidovulum sp.]|nr:hypothetical protein [Albidovulum sp.]